MNTSQVTDISNYIRDNMHTPFEWGVFDCCVFASHCVYLQTGIDLYEPYRGKYDSELSAAKAQKKYGTIEVKLDEHFERIEPATAQRGDIHMLESGVMAVQFNGIWAAATNGVSLTQDKTKLCWRIA
jgi:hypothetical protein